LAPAYAVWDIVSGHRGAPSSWRRLEAPIGASRRLPGDLQASHKELLMHVSKASLQLQLASLISPNTVAPCYKELYY